MSYPFCIWSFHKLADTKSLIFVDFETAFNEFSQLSGGFDFKYWRLQNFLFQLYLSFATL